MIISSKKEIQIPTGNEFRKRNKIERNRKNNHYSKQQQNGRHWRKEKWKRHRNKHQ